MKIINLIIGILLALYFPLFSSPDVSMDVCRFQSEGGIYIEVSLYVVGATLKCDSIEDCYGAEYIVMITDGADHVIAGNKYNLRRTACPTQDILMCDVLH